MTTPDSTTTDSTSTTGTVAPELVVLLVVSLGMLVVIHRLERWSRRHDA